MGFLASLCCSASDRQSKLEAETRHARIVTATNDHRNHYTRPRSHSHVISDSPPEYKDIDQHPLLAIDEKVPIDFQLTVEAGDDPTSLPSSRSSIVSIPSTRVTDLTAAQTGETMLPSRRESLERFSTRGSLPPPSYYSRRSPSPASITSAESEGGRGRGLATSCHVE